SRRQDGGYVQQLPVDVLLVLEHVAQGHVDDVLPVGPDHHSRLTGSQRPDGVEAEARCQRAVAGARRASALRVTEDEGAPLVAAAFLHRARQRPGAASDGSLGHDDDARVLAAGLSRGDRVGRFPGRSRHLGDQDRLGATRHAHAQGYVARAPAHHLDEEQPVVAGRRVAQPVDGLERDVDGGVEPDRHVGAVDVVVDGARDADDLDALLAFESQGAPEAAVPADDHQAVDAAPGQDLSAAGATGWLEEPLAAGGAQDSAAALDDVGDAARAQLDDVVVDQALVATVDARDSDAVMDGGAHHSSDGGVHARRVAAAGQYPDMGHG